MVRGYLRVPRPLGATLGSHTMTLVLTCALLCAVVAIDLSKTEELGDPRQLEASPDFRSVTLHWSGTDNEENMRGAAPSAARTVLVTYCELHAWGPHRCRDKSVAASRAGRGFSARVGGLRMATRYSFRVRPIPSHEETPDGRRDEIFPAASVTAQTKGFSARATLCLADSSEVEVDTGPYFGGRISVEGANGPPADTTGPPQASKDEVQGTACSVWGDPHSPRSTYRLRFEHEACGGTRAVNRSAVATFVLVQESLPILTHSTRRFLVLCTAQPDTLTVSAGISLPGAGGDNSVSHGGVGSAEAHRGARLLRNPSIPPLQPPLSSLQAQVQPRSHTGSAGAQLVLMMALVCTVAAGSGMAAWWAVRRHRQLALSSHIARHQLDSCSTTAVTLSRASSFAAEQDELSIDSYAQFATGRGAASEVSSIGTVECTEGDLTPCSSMHYDPEDDVPGEFTFTPAPTPASGDTPIYTTTIHIRGPDDVAHSEA